jgi:hypothetical protein
MRLARCFLQRQPWISNPRREGAADVPACLGDAPFLLKVRWLLEALFHPLRAAPCMWLRVMPGGQTRAGPRPDHCRSDISRWEGAEGHSAGCWAGQPARHLGQPGGGCQGPGRDLHYPAESC